MNFQENRCVTNTKKRFWKENLGDWSYFTYPLLKIWLLNWESVYF
jgi:hypothetical protein